jgi:hypothetical protein
VGRRIAAGRVILRFTLNGPCVLAIHGLEHEAVSFIKSRGLSGLVRTPPRVTITHWQERERRVEVHAPARRLTKG